MDLNSSLSKQLNNYLTERKACGFKIENIKYYIKQFDNYLNNINYNKNYLTKEVVCNYIDLHMVSENTKNHYASFLRQLGIFLNKYDNVSYILPYKRYPRNYDFTPHIFTEDEINRIFDAIKTGYYRTKPKIQNQIYLITKILFSTGMRIGEVLSLTKEDFNYHEKTFYLKNTKNNEERLITINKTLTEELKLFIDKYPSDFVYIFERNYKQLYTNDLFNAYFRKILFKAKIKHNSNGPRVHDIRHTFVVNSFRNEIKRGEDINTFLPILSTYLGHKNIYSTYKYLHLTAEIFPDLRQTISSIISLDKDIDYDIL